MLNVEELAKIHASCRILGANKNKDYSGTLDPIGVTGLPGISTRLLDKVSRLSSLVQPNAEQKVKDESIRDTLMDMINYASYGIMLLDGTWEKK